MAALRIGVSRCSSATSWSRNMGTQLSSCTFEWAATRRAWAFSSQRAMMPVRWVVMNSASMMAFILGAGVDHGCPIQNTDNPPHGPHGSLTLRNSRVEDAGDHAAGAFHLHEDPVVARFREPKREG